MLKTIEAAKYLKILASYLRAMRAGQTKTEGPSYEYGFDEKFRKNCYYSKEELDRWKNSHKFKKDQIPKNRIMEVLKKENKILKEIVIRLAGSQELQKALG